MARRSLQYARTIALVLIAMAATAIAAPANDHCADATVVSTLPFVDTVDFTAASRDYSDPGFCLTGIGTNVWYAFTPDADVDVCVRVTGGSSRASVLPLEGGCGSHLLGYNYYYCELAERFPVAAGQTVHVEVGMTYPQSEPYSVTITDAATDTDGDGVNDCEDLCRTTPGVDNSDRDVDGIGDGCDPCLGLGPDFDGDGRCGSYDGCDTIPDADVPDSDYDGWSDACDTCPGYGPTDADGDGVCDVYDNCPSVPNPTQYDYDDDWIGDACDPCYGSGTGDTDGDGWCDGNDNCPTVPNPGQEDTDYWEDGYDGDDVGDACDACPGYGSRDTDGDTVCDEIDNCVEVPNPDQRNAEGDRFGDACDACPLSGLPGTADGDGDGTPDFCDVCPEDAADGCPVVLACTWNGTLARVGLEGWMSLVGWTGYPSCSGGLAAHPSTGALYTLTYDEVLQRTVLARIDAQTGHGTPVGPLWGSGNVGSLAGLTFRNDGRLYAVGWRTSTLVTIDVVTARVDAVATIGMRLRNPAGLIFDGTRLLMVAGQTVVEVDVATGDVQGLVGIPLPPYCSSEDTHVKGLARSADGSVLGVLHCDGSINTSWEYVVRLDLGTGSMEIASQNLYPIVGVVDPNVVPPTSPPCDGCLHANDAACCVGDVSVRVGRIHHAGKERSSRPRFGAVMENLAGNPLPPDGDLQLQLRDATGTVLMCERLEGSAFVAGDRRRLVYLPAPGTSAVRKLVFRSSPDGDRAVVQASIILPPGSRPTEILLAVRPPGGTSAQCGLATVR